VLRVVSFVQGETDEGLDVVAPIVVEGELVVIRHPARGQFRAVALEMFRMKGNFQVRCSGEGAAVTSLPYPTHPDDAAPRMRPRFRGHFFHEMYLTSSAVH